MKYARLWDKVPVAAERRELSSRLTRDGEVSQMDPSEILASMLAAGMLEAGLAVRAAHTCPNGHLLMSHF